MDGKHWSDPMTILCWTHSHVDNSVPSWRHDVRLHPLRHRRWLLEDQAISVQQVPVPHKKGSTRGLSFGVGGEAAFKLPGVPNLIAKPSWLL